MYQITFHRYENAKHLVPRKIVYGLQFRPEIMIFHFCCAY